MQKSNVTVQDVAKTAGVSVGTVSRVLNGYDNISEKNLQRVKSAMKELGYNRTGRAASSGGNAGNANQSRTGNIGLCLSGMSEKWAGHPLVTQYVDGIEDVCAESNYHVLIEFAEGGGGGTPRFLKENKVDGILVKGKVLPDPVLLSIKEAIPVVCMDICNPFLDIPQIVKDDYQAGREVANHLWELGHRRIAYLSHNMQHTPFIHRRQGIEEVMIVRSGGQLRPIVRERIMDPASRLLPEESLPNVPDLVTGFFNGKNASNPTAIVCCNDWLAAGVYRTLQTIGLAPGKDVGVVGFDNDAIGNYLDPLLTTYETPFRKIASVATRLLFEILANPGLNAGNGIRGVSGCIIERDSVPAL